MLDDSEITAAATATNYTPTASTVEGHLAGLDVTAGSVVESTVPLTGTAPAGAKLGYDTTNQDLYYVDAGGNWAIFPNAGPVTSNWDLGVAVDTGEDYFDGRRIFRQTWDIGGGANGQTLLTGVEHIVNFAGQIDNKSAAINYNSTWSDAGNYVRLNKTDAGVLTVSGVGAFVNVGFFTANTVITVWYTLT